MNKLFEKARAVLKLLEGYCLRVAKAFKVVGATLNFLQAESYEMQEITEQLMLQAILYKLCNSSTLCFISHLVQSHPKGEHSLHQPL